MKKVEFSMEAQVVLQMFGVASKFLGYCFLLVMQYCFQPDDKLLMEGVGFKKYFTLFWALQLMFG